MNRYAIADYLSEEQRRAAVEAEYVRRNGFWETRHRECPLGVAVPACGFGIPVGREVAGALAPGNAELRRRIERAADAFIGDWDNGAIAPEWLAVALGVAP
jgi:hypothetical protein